MGWGKVFKYGLAAASGAAQGAAEVFEAEDKYRKDLSNTVLSVAIKEAAKRDDRIIEEQAKIDEEDAVVESLKGQQVPMKDGTTKTITEAQARQAYRRYGKQLHGLLLENKLTFGGTGTVGEGAAKKKSLLDLTQIEQAETGKGTGISTGRYDSVAETTSAALRAMNINPDAVDLPTRKAVSNVEIMAGAGTDKVTRESLYTNVPGIAGQAVTKVNKLSIDGKLTTSYEDLLGNDVTTVIKNAISSDKTKQFKVVKNYSDLSDDINVRTSGLAFKISKDGRPIAQTYSVVYTKDGRVLKQGESGKFDTPVTDPDIMTLPASVVSALGPDGIDGAFDALGKPGRKAYEDFNGQAEAFGRAINVVSNQMNLLNEHDNALVADVGSFATFKDYVMTEFGVALQFVEKEGQKFLDLSPTEQAVLENRRDQIEKDMQSQTGKTRLATAIRLYQANQILFAYASARAVTNDTRISNQDFDLFFKTVSGSNKDAQEAIYHNRLLDAKVAVGEMYTSLKTAVDIADNKNADKILSAIPEGRTATGMDARINEAMGSNKPKRTTKEVKEESDDIRKVYDKVEVRLEKVNPVNFKIDPNGVEAYVAYANGKRLITTDDDVALTTDVANTTKDDLKREVLGMIQNGYIK
jgi:hypothetical protein